MLEVDVIIESEVPPPRDAATSRYLMQAVADGRPPVLRISELKGRVLSLGRYHFAPTSDSSSTVQLTRRLCGGRALPAGEGYRTVSLVLPHRSALISDDPFALAPFQVLNRFARGLLQACKQLGVPAFYPGRDLVTVNRSVLAALSFESDAGGATLLEAYLATGSDFTSLASLLAAADPGGIVTAELWGPEATTSIRGYIGRTVDMDEMAAMLCRGYESQFEITFRGDSLSSTAVTAIEAEAASMERSWLKARRWESGMDEHRVRPAQVGVLEARFSTDDTGRIGSIVLGGDFIANSAAVEVLEQRLRGCPLRADAIDRIVNDVFDGQENFILGIGTLDAISGLLVEKSAA